MPVSAVAYRAALDNKKQKQGKKKKERAKISAETDKWGKKTAQNIRLAIRPNRKIQLYTGDVHARVAKTNKSHQEKSERKEEKM